MADEFSWDVFISHASEDKHEVAGPLAEELRKRGLKVWYDKWELVVGDRLRESIDRGLAESRYGVVILSHHFFDKAWPKDELEGFIARERDGKKCVLPVWHKLTKDEVEDQSPILSGRLGALTSEGIQTVADRLIHAMERETASTVAAAAKGSEMFSHANSTKGVVVPPASDGASCPHCGTGSLQWAKWAPGPAGLSTAWYVCTRCGHLYPSMEAFGD